MCDFWWNFGGSVSNLCAEHVGCILHTLTRCPEKQLKGGKMCLGSRFQRASIHPGGKDKGALQCMQQEPGPEAGPIIAH